MKGKEKQNKKSLKLHKGANQRMQLINYKSVLLLENLVYFLLKVQLEETKNGLQDNFHY